MANALRSVATHRESRPLLHHADNLERGPVTNPVGLENIGNTCYLNSILQYLYTVQPIRDLVESYGENRLDVADIDKRRIGGSKSKVQPVDLIVGQHCQFPRPRAFDRPLGLPLCAGRMLIVL